MKSWYSIHAKAEQLTTEISIFDEIGYWGVTAKDFIDDLKTVPPNHKILLRIHSPGGEVFDGNAIANAIARHPGGYEAQIEGLAASMATVISLGARPVKMAANGFYMIHNPWGSSMGNAADMRAQADLLEKIQSGIVNAYANKSGQTHEQIQSWMDAETWFTAQEAKDAGFVDEVTDAHQMAASSNRFDRLEKFRNTPGNLTTCDLVMSEDSNNQETETEDVETVIDATSVEAIEEAVVEEAVVEEVVVEEVVVEEATDTPVATINGAESILAKFNDLQARFDTASRERDEAIAARAVLVTALDRLERSLGVASAKIVPAVEMEQSLTPDISSLTGYDKVRAAFSKTN